jgi:hypothetical protein
MAHIKWQRMFAVGILLLTTLFPVGAALAASPLHPACFNPSCLQRVNEDVGSVLPEASSSNFPQQCDRLGSAGMGIIPVTGEVNGSASWRGVGTLPSPSALSGWHDAGAGSR